MTTEQEQRAKYIVNASGTIIFGAATMWAVTGISPLEQPRQYAAIVSGVMAGQFVKDVIDQAKKD